MVGSPFLLVGFLQADPFVEAPTNTQSLNHYSYLWNNPLNATDPSGFLRSDCLKSNYLRPAVAVAVVFTVAAVSVCGTCGLVRGKPHVLLVPARAVWCLY